MRSPRGPVSGGLSLALASPHPSDRPLRLSYMLPLPGPVSLRIFDIGGRAVRTLASGDAGAGAHAVEWDGRDDTGTTLASGTYFARLVTEGGTVSRTLVRAR